MNYWRSRKRLTNGRSIKLNPIRRYESDIARDLLAAVSAGPAGINKYVANVERYEKEGGEIQDEAKRLEVESHVRGAQALRTHVGEVFLEIAIVLASLAILSKRRPMWFASIASGLGGDCNRCDSSSNPLAIGPRESMTGSFVAATLTGLIHPLERMMLGLIARRFQGQPIVPWNGRSVTALRTVTSNRPNPT